MHQLQLNNRCCCSLLDEVGGAALAGLDRVQVLPVRRETEKKCVGRECWECKKDKYKADKTKSIARP